MLGHDNVGGQTIIARQIRSGDSPIHVLIKVVLEVFVLLHLTTKKCLSMSAMNLRAPRVPSSLSTNMASSKGDMVVVQFHGGCNGVAIVAKFAVVAVASRLASVAVLVVVHNFTLRT